VPSSAQVQLHDDKGRASNQQQHQYFDNKLVQACTSLYKPVQAKKFTSKKAKQVLFDFSQVCF
jgi:hypothetical protein